MQHSFDTAPFLYSESKWWPAESIHVLNKIKVLQIHSEVDSFVQENK